MFPEDLVLLAMAGLGSVGATAAAVLLRRRINGAAQEADAAWSRWAQRRGLAYTPPRGIAGILAPPQAQGVIDGVALSLDGMDLDPHESVALTATRRERRRMPHTVLAARALNIYPGAMLVMSRARIDDRTAVQGYRQMDLADARFDEACALYAGPWSPAHRLEDRTVRAALVRLAQRPFVLFAQGGSLWVRWPGYERDADILDHAATALVGLARDRA